MTRPYIVVNTREHRPSFGRPRIVRDDCVFVVGPSGHVIDISTIVTGFEVVSHVGEPRRLRLELIGFDIDTTEVPS